MTTEEHRTHDGHETTATGVGRTSVEDGLGRVAAVTANEYRLAVRSRWAVALTALFGVFALMLITFSGSAVGPEGFERIVASLVNLAVYLLPLAALAFGYDVIVGPDESGWLDVLFALPVTRARVVVGAYLGRAAVLAGATVIGFGVAGALLVGEFGTDGWSSYVVFLLAAVAVGLAFLSMAALVSSVAAEKAHALGIALLVWVWFVLIHDLIALGVIAAFDLPDTVITLMILANPADVFRLLVLSRLEIGGGAGFTAVLAQANLSIGVLVAAMVAWIVVPVAVAALLVRRRRL